MTPKTMMSLPVSSGGPLITNPVHSQTWTVCKGTIVGWIERENEQEREGNVSFMLLTGSIIHAIIHSD